MEDNFITVLKPHSKYSLHDAITFSPSFLGSDSVLKKLFVVFQMLKGAKEIHDLGLCVGEISLRDVMVNDRFYVAIRPNVLDNLVDVKVSEQDILSHDEASLSRVTGMSDKVAEMLKSFKRATKLETNEEDQIRQSFDLFLGEIVTLWCQGKVNNYDYILLLNYLSGRSFSNPYHYPVMPWVRDFSSDISGWRDMSKSKFRLNKGDTQLDLVSFHFSVL